MMSHFLNRFTTFLVLLIAAVCCSCGVLQNSSSMIHRDEQVSPINQAIDGIPMSASATSQQIAVYNASVRQLLEKILHGYKPENMRGALVVDEKKSSSILGVQSYCSSILRYSMTLKSSTR
jgi:hypothetical protein